MRPSGSWLDDRRTTGRSGSRRARSTRAATTSSTSSARTICRSTRTSADPSTRSRGLSTRRRSGRRRRHRHRRRPVRRGNLRTAGRAVRTDGDPNRPRHGGSPWAWSLQTEVSPFDVLTVVDAGDAPVVPGRPERSLRVIHEKVRRVARAGAVPIVLGGDHSSRIRPPPRSPGCTTRASGSCTSTRTPIRRWISGDR